MFLVKDNYKERKNRIRDFLKTEPPIAIILSAVNVGLLSDYGLDTGADRTAKNWKVWKVRQAIGSFKDLEGGLYDKQQSAGLDVITLIMDWISGFSNVRKSQGVTHKDLTRWIDKLGTKEVYKIFLNIQNRTEKTHPGHLFKLLKIKAKQSE